MIDILQRAAREAGEILKKYYKKGIQTSNKTSFKDLVTKADYESQQKIYDVILGDLTKKQFKKEDIGFVGEENLNINGTHKFIIDPLDGTNNFASGFDYFCVSIGYMKNNQVIAGVIYNPLKDTLYFAQKTKGAYKIQNNIEQRLIMHYRKLSKMLCATIYHSVKNVYEKEVKITDKIYPHIRGIRINHSAALDLALCSDEVFGLSLAGLSSIWDIAAGSLIIEESKGAFVDWSGKKIRLDPETPFQYYPYIACHPKLLPEVLPFFKNQ